jgi:hypothetical protein
VRYHRARLSEPGLPLPRVPSGNPRRCVVAPFGLVFLALTLVGAGVVRCVRMDSDSCCTTEMIELLGHGPFSAAEKGTLPKKRIDTSMRRVLSAKMHDGVGRVGEFGLASVNSAAHLRTVADLLDRMADRKAEDGQP